MQCVSCFFSSFFSASSCEHCTHEMERQTRQKKYETKDFHFNVHVLVYFNFFMPLFLLQQSHNYTICVQLAKLTRKVMQRKKKYQVSEEQMSYLCSALKSRDKERDNATIDRSETAQFNFEKKFSYSCWS